MIVYMIRRVVLIIPTIFIILVLSFVLKNLAPGDDVGRQLELDGAMKALSGEHYMEAYRTIAVRYSLDKPQFYFSITPSYFPDTLHRIFPKEKKEMLTSMLRQTKNWEQCNLFNSLLSQIKLDLSKFEEEVEIKSLIRKIELDKSLSDVKSRIVDLSKTYNDSDLTIESLSSLIGLVNEMETANAISWPVIRWHGAQNQFHRWIVHLTGKSNTSLVDGVPAFTKIFRALKWTLIMSLTTLILIIVISLTLGMAMVYFKDRLFDRITAYFLFLLFAIPTFWLATMMVIFFTTPEYGTWTDIFPSLGIRPSFTSRSFLDELMLNLEQLILPVICMTIVSISYLTIQLRSDLIETLSRPYILTARAKGLNYWQILKSHALPNALLPFTTIITGAIPNIFAGSVVIEVIFNIPGIGRLMLHSMTQNDWPVVFTIIIVISLATMISYLLGDVILMKLFPKTQQTITTQWSGSHE